MRKVKKENVIEIIEIENEIRINENAVLEVGDKIQLIPKVIKESGENRDLLDIISIGERPSKYWPNVSFKNRSLFETYMNSQTEISEFLGIGKPYDDSDNLDGQESYLGYSPSKNMFISGWDCWYSGETEDEYGFEEYDEIASGLVYFRIREGKIRLLKKEVKTGSMMYDSRGGGLQDIRKEFRDLQDIRLD